MNCIHWFVIETPDGREYLPARCKKCGARTEFKAGEEHSARCKKCGARTEFKAGEEHWSKPIPHPSRVKEEAVKGA
jgi:tRNA(Ile2) C34 agmatinyltransferase TiaS